MLSAKIKTKVLQNKLKRQRCLVFTVCNLHINFWFFSIICAKGNACAGKKMNSDATPSCHMEKWLFMSVR